MWDNLLHLGGNEIVNTSRVVALAETVGLPLGIDCAECGSIPDVVRTVYDGSDDLGDITNAPWYDPDDPASENLIGLVGLSIRNTLSSTRESPVVQRLGDGGVLGRERNATRDLRVTGLLVARDRLSIDYGMNWLSSALDRGACGQHGDRCGLSDVEWLTDCPPAQGMETDTEYAETVHPYRRTLHDVAATSGPLLLDQNESDCFIFYEVEFTITAQEPKVLGAAKDFELAPAYLDGVSEVVKNLVKSPSAEISSTIQREVARNLVRNPSFEASTDFWTGQSNVLEGDEPPEDPSVQRVLDGSNRPWVTGDYYGNIGIQGYPVTQDTTVEVIAQYAVSSSDIPPEGRYLRAGVTIFKDWYNSVRIEMLSLEGGGEFNLVSSGEVTDYGAHDLMTSESLMITPTSNAVLLRVVLTVSGYSSVPVPTTGINFDAAWIMEG